MLFIQAKNYTKNKSGHRTISHIVIHDMESAEKPDTAENVAKWFAGPDAPQASAHYCCDNNSVVRSVQDMDIAWAAPGANNDGLHFELAGRAAQTRTQWLDNYDKEMFETVANLVAHRCLVYHVPPKKISGADIKAGRPGICGHADVTAAFPNLGDHQDPGHNFPWDYFIARVQHYYQIWKTQ